MWRGCTGQCSGRGRVAVEHSVAQGSGQPRPTTLSVYTNSRLCPSPKLWKWTEPRRREWGMKGNMPGLIRAVPRRELEERSQGSTKGIDIPLVEASCRTKSLHTLCSHRAKPEQSQAATARAHLPLFVCSSHTPANELSEYSQVHTGLDFTLEIPCGV